MPVQIHGKEYLTVAERLDMMNKKTEGSYSINTEVIKFESGCVIIKATLKIGDNVYSGHAMEEAGSNKINETSFVEVCETSAIGRALASASYHGTEFCSAEELVIALENQKPKTKQSNMVDKVKEKFNAKDVDGSEAQISNPISFGKHNGKEWKDIPEDYVVWCAKNSKVDWQRTEAQRELDRRNSNGVPNRPNKASGGMSEVAYEETVEMPL